MNNKENLVIDQVAYEFNEKDYHFKATYLKEPKGESLIEITKNGELIRDFLFPSYKIYNISAHARDIVEGLENESNEGLLLAGSTGLGGNVFKIQ